MKFFKLNNNLDNPISVELQTTERTGSASITSDKGFNDYADNRIKDNNTGEIFPVDSCKYIRYYEVEGVDLNTYTESDSEKTSRWIETSNILFSENGWRAERINSCMAQHKINGEIYLYVGCKYLIFARGSVEINEDTVDINQSGTIANSELKYQLNTLSVFKLSQFFDESYDCPTFIPEDSEILKQIFYEYRTIKPLQRLAFRTIADFSVEETHQLDEYFINIINTKTPQEADYLWSQMIEKDVTLTTQYEWNPGQFTDVPDYNNPYYDYTGSVFTGEWQKITSSFSNREEIITRPSVIPSKVVSNLKTKIIDVLNFDPTDPNTFTDPLNSNKVGNDNESLNPSYNGKYDATGPLPQLNYKFPRYFWGDQIGIHDTFIISQAIEGEGGGWGGYNDGLGRWREYYYNNNYNNAMDGTYNYGFNRFYKYSPGSMFTAYPEELNKSHYIKSDDGVYWTEAYSNETFRPFRQNMHSSNFRDYLTEEIVGIKTMKRGSINYLFLSMGNRPHFEYTSGSIIAGPVYYELETSTDRSEFSESPEIRSQLHSAFEFLGNVPEEVKDDNDIIIKLQNGYYSGNGGNGYGYSYIDPNEEYIPNKKETCSARPQFLPDAIYRLEILPNGLVDTASLLTTYTQYSMDLDLEFPGPTIKDTFAYMSENGGGINQQSSFSILNHLIVDEPYSAIRYMDGVKFEFDNTYINMMILLGGDRWCLSKYRSNKANLDEQIESRVLFGIEMLCFNNWLKGSDFVINFWDPSTYSNYFQQQTIYHDSNPESHPPPSIQHYIETHYTDPNWPGSLQLEPNTGWYSKRDQIVTRLSPSPYLAFEVVK